MRGTIEETLEHAKFFARHFSGGDPQGVTISILMELRIPPNRDGYQCLKNAILLRFQHPGYRFTKGIYPGAGELCDPQVSGDSAEQSIRVVIDEAWEHRNEKVWALYFPQEEDGSIEKPESSAFISWVASFLELWRSCAKEVSYERA